MDLKRLTRVISDRWVIVLIGGLVGLGGAMLWVALAPSGETVHEATAAVRFEAGEGQTAQQVADALNAQRGLALQLAQEILGSDPTAQIRIDLGASELQFTRQGTSAIEARTRAEELRDTYQDLDPDAEIDIGVRLEKLEQDARDLDDAIADLQPGLTQAQQEILDQQIQLDLTIDSVRGRLRDLVLAEAAAATSDEEAAIQEERSNLESQLEELLEARSALGETPTPEMSTEDSLHLSALQARRDSLLLEYQRLYLQSVGVGGRGLEQVTRLTQFQSEPIDPVLVAGLGLVGGAAVAILGLLMVSRTRRIVWMADDIDVPVLGEVPARPVDVRGNEAWYDEAEPGPRKTAVQALRSAVQAQAHSSGSTIALTGHNIASEDVLALAADLAGSMASAGDSVLLIDANFESRAALGVYRVGGMSLVEILRLPAEAPQTVAQVENAVESAHVVRSGLAVIPSGPPPGSPADSLAGRQFRSLIAAAESKYDATILVVDDFGTPSSKVAMQRLSHGIVVTSPGSTTETDLNGLIDDADRLRISILGAVFLRKRPRFARWFRRKETPEEEPRKDRRVPDADKDASSPMTRLGSYPIPDERRSAMVQHSPLGELANSFGLIELQPEEELGSELLVALEAADSRGAYEAVAEYVVSRAEDMVTARYGYGDLLKRLIEDVSEYGFISLQPVKNHRTVGSWLTEEIEHEVSWDSGAEVVGRFERMLSGDGALEGIDTWLDREFFTRHLERTEGEPEVWHLVSPEHSVSLLVPARRMTAAKLEGVMTEVVSASIDEIERKKKAALTKSDDELVAQYEQELWDIRSFEKRMRQVIYGEKSGHSKSSTYSWNPDWTEGTRAHMAPFQSRGLLPFDVLSEEEMSSLSATA